MGIEQQGRSRATRVVPNPHVASANKVSHEMADALLAWFPPKPWLAEGWEPSFDAIMSQNVCLWPTLVL